MVASGDYWVLESFLELRLAFQAARSFAEETTIRGARRDADREVVLLETPGLNAAAGVEATTPARAVRASREESFGLFMTMIKIYETTVGNGCFEIIHRRFLR
jgi:hypothetical protein